jgi:hypothetical protein
MTNHCFVIDRIQLKTIHVIIRILLRIPTMTMKVTDEHQLIPSVRQKHTRQEYCRIQARRYRYVTRFVLLLQENMSRESSCYPSMIHKHDRYI